MILNNIKLSQYFELSDRSEYDYLITYHTDSKDIFSIGDITQLPFGDVKEIQYKFNKGVTIKDIIEFISKCTSKKIKEIGSINILEFVQINNYIKKQVEFINTIEENGLISPVDADAEQAGVDRFNKFGYWIQIDKLAGGDPLKYDKVKSLTYMDCFTKLKYEVEKDDYLSTLRKIKTRKNGKV